MAYKAIVSAAGIVQQIVYVIAVGVLSNLLALKNGKLNYSFALGLILLIVCLPSILLFFSSPDYAFDENALSAGLKNIILFSLTMAGAVAFSFFVGRVIVRWQISKLTNRKNDGV